MQQDDFSASPVLFRLFHVLLGTLLAVAERMSTGPDLPISCTVRWAQEWHQLSWISISRAMAHHLEGCANVAMARTPLEALAALHETQAVLIRHSAGVFVHAAKLWRKQSSKRVRTRSERSAPHGRPRSAA